VSTDGAGDKAGRADEDAVWREIVENYGDRPELEDDPQLATAATTRSAGPEDLFDDDVDDTETVYLEDSESWVPPAPPPLPRTTPDRLLAWAGVLGTPAAAIVLLLVDVFAKWAPPAWLMTFLAFAFLGGFGYLVYAMKDAEPRDPWDDGSRL
jgi:hypothetical protein